MRKIILEEQEALNLMRVRQDSGLTTRNLADKAGLELREVYLAEIGVAVEEEMAVRIIQALNQLTGSTHTLQTIAINIRKRMGTEQSPIQQVRIIDE